jgi:transketolase
LSRGRDITVLSSGICTQQAVSAVTLLTRRGLSIRHLHVSTLKPFDDPTIIEALHDTTLGVITMENHTVIGGLGSAVAELMAEHGVACRLKRLGLQDTFAHGASLPYLLKTHKLTALDLAHSIQEFAGTDFPVSYDELEAVSTDARQGLGAEQLEAL